MTKIQFIPKNSNDSKQVEEEEAEEEFSYFHLIFTNDDDDDTNILFTFYVCGCDTIHSFIHTITHTHTSPSFCYFFFN